MQRTRSSWVSVLLAVCLVGTFVPSASSTVVLPGQSAVAAAPLQSIAPPAAFVPPPLHGAPPIRSQPQLPTTTANFRTNLSSPWTAVGGTWTDATDGKQGSGSGDAFYMSSSTATNFVYEGDLKLTSTDTNSVRAAQLVFRAQDRTNPGAGAYLVNINTTNGGEVKLFRFGQVVLAQAAVPIQLNTVYHLKVEAVGGTFKVYFNHSQHPTLTASDSAYASGYLGLNVYQTSAIFQNVTVGAPPPPPPSTFRTNLSSPWTAVGGTWTDATDGKQGSGSGDAFYMSSSTATDFVYEGNLKLTSTNANSVRAAQLVFRAQNRTNPGAGAYLVNINTTNGGEIKLFRFGQAVLAQAAVPIQLNTAYHLKVEAVGSTFKVYLNNSSQPLLTASDTAYTKGYFGLNVYQAAAIFQNVYYANTSLLANDQVLTPEDCSCHPVPVHYSTPQPVDTRTGNFWTTTTDLTVASVGPAMSWARTYSSQATGALNSGFGAGWQHPFAARLILPTMTGGEPGRIVIISPKGNRLRFADRGGGIYRALPGIYSTLVAGTGVYTQTLPNQQQFVFNAATGQLTAVRDAQGHQLTLTYTGTPARLERITDASDSTRFLALTYDTAGRISSVSDGTRTVGYTYTNGDLTGVTDVMGRATTYTYQNHLLTDIKNALGQTVEHMVYDTYSPTGKVMEQMLQDGRRLQFTYHANTSTVTTTAPTGQQDVQQIDYAPNNTLTAIRRNGQLQLNAEFDSSFSPGSVKDGNGNLTNTTYTSRGQPQAITDALGHTTRIAYDAQSRPITVTDTLGRQTAYTYDANNNLLRETTGITTAFPLGFTTVYTYNVRYAGKQWLEAQRTPDGIVTQYDYDPQGQRTSSTVGYGTPLAQTTTYGYDALGRVTTTTTGVGTPHQRRDTTQYNADNTIAQTVQNYQDGTFDPAKPDEDVRTIYGYDVLDRQVWERDVLGHYTVTQYDAKGRVAWTARNLQASTFDAQQQPPAQPPAYSPARPDANVATLYGYDGLGRTTLVTETGILTGTFNATARTFGEATTRVTRTDYDAQSRPITTTLNYRPDLPVGTLPDVNVQLVTRYDAAGNVVGQRDALGRWTVTEYDALNRPTKVIHNYENGDPRTVDAANRAWTDGTDTDLVTMTRYTADGQVERQIDNAVDEQFTATEPLTDRITVYAYDAIGRPTTTTQNADPATQNSRSDTNRTTTTTYDATTGRVVGTQDALGRWTSQQYDVLGRVTTTIQNCRNAQGQAVAQGCAAFDAGVPDRNVPMTTRYDALGRLFDTVDALGITTRTRYDGLGRVTATIQNYGDGQFDPATPDADVTTATQYDALGQVARRTDAANANTNQGYDGLGQTSIITDSVGRVTRVGYDGTGTARWQHQPDGRLTVHAVDGLGRVVTTIQNYQDGGVGTDEPTDRDLITRTRYDAGGRRVQTVDAAGRVTAFGYTGRDQLMWVQENVRDDCVSATLAAAHKPCNVTTRYRYDRAGNRTAIVDARAHTRTFMYDAADRQIEARDALGRITTWEYDLGGRTRGQHDGRGAAADVTWTYDDLDRPNTTHAAGLGTTIDANYDAGGRRTQLVDSTGTTTIGYDALGRITHVAAPQTGSLGYSYTARGERASLTYPDGARVDYAYWPDGQIKTVSDGGTTLANYRYDAAGRVQDVTRANGTVTTYGYDAADRVRDVRTTLNTVTLSQFQYTVDRVGHRTAVTEAVGGQSRTISYSYDGLERLTHATEQGGTAYRYAYDAVGNRTDVWTNDTLQEHRDYDAANQVVGWQYDQAGNLLGDGQTSYTYDPLNRLATTTRGSATTTNTYNGDGVLIAQESGGTTTRYVQDLQAPLPQVLATTQGSATTRYVYGLDRLASVSGTTRTWEVHDALGSARQTLGNNGQPTSTLRYDAWGMPVDNTQPAPFGFTGEFQDAMSGLVYLRARWYNPSTGTFLQRDPFEGFDTQPYSLHPYQYAYSNPVLYTDPSGQCVDAAGRAVPCAGSEPQPADAARSAADHVGRSLDTTAALRYAYQEGEAGIAVVVQRMQAEGKSEAEIARWAVNARNTLRQTIRDQGEPIIEFIAQRARGARDMPTYDYLRDVREKTDAQIIASASRSNPGADLWAGRLRVAGRIIIGIDIGIAGYRVATAGVDWPQVLIHETGRIGGALAGGWAGAKLGAAGGGAAGAAAGGIGAVPGAAAGSIICGLGGAVVGGWAGGEVADWTIEQLFPPDQTRFEAR